MTATLWTCVPTLSQGFILEARLVKVNLILCLLVHQYSFLAIGGALRSSGSTLKRNRWGAPPAKASCNTRPLSSPLLVISNPRIHANVGAMSALLIGA